MPRPRLTIHPSAPGDWTILHRSDPAMEVHLALMVDATDDALRDRWAFDRLARRPVPPVATPSWHRRLLGLVRRPA